MYRGSQVENIIKKEINYPYLTRPVEIYERENGHKIVLAHKEGGLVNVSSWVKTGSINENDENNGISHFLEHLMFKGTHKHKAGYFDKTLEAKGAIVNAATWKDYTFYYVTLPKGPNDAYLKEAVELHADMMLDPVIPEDEIGPVFTLGDDNVSQKRERHVVIEEIRMRQDQPWTKIYNSTNKTYYYKITIDETNYIKDEFLSYEEALSKEQDLIYSIYPNGNNRSLILNNLTYRDGLVLFKNYLQKFTKITYFREIERAMNHSYFKYFPNESLIINLTKIDADKAWEMIKNENNNYATKNKKLNFLKRFFYFIYQSYLYYYSYIFILPLFKDYSITRIVAKPQILELEKIKAVIKKENSEYYKLALLTLFIYGYRLSELLGLKVDSISFKDKTIENYQSVNFKTGNGGFIVIPPKTKKSDRINSLSDEYANLLMRHIKSHHLKSDDYLFFSLGNKSKNDNHSIPIHENTFRRHLKSLDKDLTPHKFRRSLVTHLKERGISIDEIALYLGHDSIKVTDEYYLKKSKEKDNKIDKLIEKLVKEMEG